MKIFCNTLFDITCTGVTGHFKSARIPFKDITNKVITDVDSWNYSRNQQRNWETITQLIAIRTQSFDLITPIMENNVWFFNFEIETLDVFKKDGDDLLLLKSDCNQVPMLLNLKETGVTAPYLRAFTPDQNIWFWT